MVPDLILLFLFNEFTSSTKPRQVVVKNPRSCFFPEVRLVLTLEGLERIMIKTEDMLHHVANCWQPQECTQFHVPGLAQHACWCVLYKVLKSSFPSQKVLAWKSWKIWWNRTCGRLATCRPSNLPNCICNFRKFGLHQRPALMKDFPD